MMIPLPALFILWVEAARCLEQNGGFNLKGDIRHFALHNGTVYIATEEMLYQLNHDLTLVWSLTQRGFLTQIPGKSESKLSRSSDKWNVTFSVNMLLPHVAEEKVIACGVFDSGCGYCELLDLKDISKVLYWENIEVGSLWRSSASVNFLVSVETRTRAETYILTAVQQYKVEPTSRGCPSVSDAVNLRNTNNNQEGQIFSINSEDIGPAIKREDDVEFVDGFQINSTIYLFSNLPAKDKTNKVRLLWLEGSGGKHKTLKSLRGATLKVSDGETGLRLIASSVIPGGPPVLWSGVFSLDGGHVNTELVLFDISPDFTVKEDEDRDFFFDKSVTSKLPMPIIRKPKKVIFKQNSMTSVLAVRHKNWTVFYIGTGDGQLIKLMSPVRNMAGASFCNQMMFIQPACFDYLCMSWKLVGVNISSLTTSMLAVDNNYKATCSRVLYKTSDDRKVFQTLHLDQVDLKHVYVPFQNQINRVPVSKCSTYKTLQNCWSAQDPYCVWCSSEKSCTFEDDCKDSDWLSIPDDSQQKMVSYKLKQENIGQITLTIQMHLSAGKSALSNFTCQFSTSSREHFKMKNPQLHFPQCTFILENTTLPAEGLPIELKVRLGTTELLERLNLRNCTKIRGQPTSVLCRQCIDAGCGWTANRCSWAKEGHSVCQLMESWMNFSRPQLSSITPSVVSFYGRNNAVLKGFNLSSVSRVRIQGDMDCTPREFPVWDNTGENLTFHIPSAENKGVVKVCLLLPDGSCHGSASITYRSAPSCTSISPTSTWLSGKRKITLTGSLVELVEAIRHSKILQEVRLPSYRSDQALQNLTYNSPAAENIHRTFLSSLSLKVANETLNCATTITYYPDPEFTSFSSIRTGDDVLITIQKKADKLEMSKAELSVWGIDEGRRHHCVMQEIESDFFTCEIQNTRITTYQELEIQYGDKTVTLKSMLNLYLLMLLFLLLIPCIIIAVVIIYRSKQKKFTEKMNRVIEDLELDIRNDIRQGFVELQCERDDLMENVGAIPFLDYKHFASRIFFPENESLMKLCVKDISQDTVKVQLDESCKVLSRLIQDQLFLTSMVHALEEQKSFTIKDKCVLASLLTVVLHNNLSYLTDVMEALLKALMNQSSNTQPKLLLRRTESTVEKLLTNWMSICLYGYLRETVGQHLFLMVSALTQQTAKGPVDCVTEKALYTLSEDWLLWQAQDFTSLKLKVLFAVGSDGEVSEPLDVKALSCDSIEQVKEKILSTFKAKFGFPYITPLRDVCIEFEKDGSFVPLEEVDSSSEVIGEVTMLNTLKHYEVPDGATIKVLSKKTHPPLSPQGSLKDDENFSGKYFHLIDPDVDEDQRKNPERKKLKLKEVHLTKLLSTKVAVHSFVENLFRSIWGMPHCRAPHAIKFFFDFLDTQADNMKITDPDVLHIWKTNSLPLRFWINILKNPHFVFDMETTPNLNCCLSVIAQAFMDSFSLSETQLGKHAPTNKLLYAKDIPKYKQEVKFYYKQIREQPRITASEFKTFLLEESKKHENEFNEAAALRELYKFIQRYFTEIKEKLGQNGAPAELIEQLHKVKHLFDGLKSCSWN